MTQSDWSLAQACADRDARAWNELLARYDRRVLTALRRAGAKAADLHDLRQEVYARLLADDGAALRSLRAERGGALGAFIAQISTRVCIDHQRCTRLQSNGEVDEQQAQDVAAPHLSPETEALVAQARASFSRALLAASAGPMVERDLTLLRAYFEQGLAPQELLGHGLSLKGVETLVRRARLHIERALQSKAM